MQETILAAIDIIISKAVSKTHDKDPNASNTRQNTVNPSTYKSKHTTIYIIARILYKERESRPSLGASSTHED